ncbi:MAG: hypothetical protein D6744_01435 [Planctomycetota bacterium]|nr:MAG: hypothetical protein D6744_01435 [Planctomycetota bacterium]
MRTRHGSWSALLAAICLISHATAAEVVVKNDSITDNTQVVVEAGFIGGERAAAWLTAPCDGTIVAVQVGWFDDNESTSGATSLESSITIHGDGAYPTPGAVLAFLEAPLMTEGFLNEFRFLDENQTIPIAVPITQGERFVIAFEFAQQPPSNGPSVVADNDDCHAQSNAIFCLGGACSGWTDWCNFFPQFRIGDDFMIRAVIDCAALQGACCLPDGSCQQMTAADCATAGGTYQGDLSDCAGVTCPQPSGACCFDTGGCLNFTQADCITAGGAWKGPGSDCNDPNFTCNPIGACCMPDGSCMDNMTPEDCTAAGGAFQGDGTDCGTANCPLPSGACCFSTGGCLVLTSDNCSVAGGTWMGIGTDCADGNGNGTADACEAPAPCPGDLNGDRTVDLTDLALLLSDFDCTSGCSGDVDGDDDTDLTDLAILLANFDATCP